MKRQDFAFYAEEGLGEDEEPDFDEEYRPPAKARKSGGKERPAKRPAPAGSPPPGAGGAISPGKAVRSRPTNNQLL
jgi:hypothetical protein